MHRPPPPRRRRSVRRLVARVTSTALAALLALLLAACGEEAEPERATSPTEHSETDVVFASEMIPHHAQALSMVDLVRERPVSGEVQALADEITATQATEIELMADWLADWGEDIPETMRDHTNAGHGDHDASDALEEMDHPDMPGMLSAEEFANLEDASDAEFETRWLELMIEHHRGALEMTEDQVEQGMFEPAIELAEEMSQSQAAEVERMEELLAR